MQEVIVDSNKRECEVALDRAIKFSLDRIAASIEAESKKQLQSMIYGRKESENYNRTGNLINSVSHKRTGALEVEVSADAEYAIYVHEGTRNNSPKPFMANALKRVEKQLEEITDLGLRKFGFR
jgi:HK97 gp10 family phage protein